MRKLTLLVMLMLVAGCLVPAAAADDATLAPTVGIRETTLDIWVRSVTGADDSAKFLEYRDIPGLSGAYEMRYRRSNAFLHYLWTEIGEDDQSVSLSGGRQGQYKAQLFFDSLPHRFAYNARTLYSGLGTGQMTLPDDIQTTLQGSASSAAAASSLRSIFDSRSSEYDSELVRKRYGANLNYVVSEPFMLKLNMVSEKREGTRPFSGSFGLGSSVEVVEPIDYQTDDITLSAEYAKARTYLAATFNSSRFHNNIGTLSFDNPFRATDSSTSTAYQQTYQAGASRGLVDLYPDNRYSSLTFTGLVGKMPANGNLSATVSWGKMKQDDELVPYTTNTAMNPTVDGSPLVASSASSLPVNKIDAKVETTLYNFVYTAKPFEKSSFRARYRLYDYDNRTPEYDFPGYGRFDATWAAGEVANEVISHKIQNLTLDWEYDIARNTELGIGFDNEVMRRKHREVSRSAENTWFASVDHHSASWLDLRASVDVSRRRWNDYDYTVPFGGETVTPQLPFLRKYDEANRNRTAYRLLATALPSEQLALTLSADYGKDNYVDSTFGLTGSRDTSYTIDADYTLNNGASVYGFLSRERYSYGMYARQWTPGAIGDPYGSEPGEASNSNWSADGRDKVTTIGTGLNWPIKPRKLDFRASYAYSKAKGRIGFDSPLGTSANDSNAFDPLDWDTVDSSRLHTVDLALEYTASRQVGFTLGYVFEGFQMSDFNQDGFTYVPVNATGGYNGALLAGTLPANYSAHIVYGRVRYRF